MKGTGLRGWVRISELAHEAGVSRSTIWRIVRRLNAERVGRGAPPLLRRMGPKGGVHEIRMAFLRLDLQEGTESLAERADNVDWRLRQLDIGHAALRRAVDRLVERFQAHTARQVEVEAATEKTLHGLKESLAGLFMLDSIRNRP